MNNRLIRLRPCPEYSDSFFVLAAKILPKSQVAGYMTDFRRFGVRN